SQPHRRPIVPAAKTSYYVMSKEGSTRSHGSGFLASPARKSGMVQTQVTAQGCLGSTPERRRPQIRGWRAGGSLAVSSPTPATPLLSPAKIRELNHAAFASLSYPTDRQVLRNPHVGRPGFLVSMSIHPRTAARPGRHAGLLLTPNCQSRSARSRHT